MNKKNPYREWAYMTYIRDLSMHNHLTTSNPQLLIKDRSSGASILIATGGDMPMAGDFDRDGINDDVAVYRSSTRIWYYDYNHNARTDEKRGPYGLHGDRPVVVTLIVMASMMMLLFFIHQIACGIMTTTSMVTLTPQTDTGDGVVIRCIPHTSNTPRVVDILH